MQELTVQVSNGAVINCRGRIVIGRDDTCDVVLASSEVSRRHATINPHADGFLLTDESANGTYMGTQLVRGGTIALDLALPLTIGPFRLDLVAAAPPAPNLPVVAAERTQPEPVLAPELV